MLQVGEGDFTKWKRVCSWCERDGWVPWHANDFNWWWQCSHHSVSQSGLCMETSKLLIYTLILKAIWWDKDSEWMGINVNCIEESLQIVRDSALNTIHSWVCESTDNFNSTLIPTMCVWNDIKRIVIFSIVNKDLWIIDLYDLVFVI